MIESLFKEEYCSKCAVCSLADPNPVFCYNFYLENESVFQTIKADLFLYILTGTHRRLLKVFLKKIFCQKCNKNKGKKKKCSFLKDCLARMSAQLNEDYYSNEKIIIIGEYKKRKKNNSIKIELFCNNPAMKTKIEKLI